MKADNIELLDSYCQNMADTIIPLLDHINLEDYQNFLEMMYHYTLESGKRLQHAADQAQNKELKKVFAELAREEQYHYRLAEGDLRTFGKQIASKTPNIVSEFNQFWLNISPQEEYQYVGALYVLENVARYLKDNVMPHFVRLQIKPEQGKFVLTHLVADDEHGDLLRMLCQNMSNDANQQLLIGAKTARTFWIEIHKSAFK